MAVVGCTRSPGDGLLLRSLRIRQYLSSCARYVYAIPHCRPCRRIPVLYCSCIAGFFLKSFSRVDSLWNDTGTNLFRDRIRFAAKVVAVRVDRIHSEYLDLDGGGSGVVEDPGLVVKER
jgi:hypothetical protein